MNFDSYLAKVAGTNHFIWVNGSDGVNRNWVEFLFLHSSKIHRGVAQPGSAPRSGRGGRRFESCRPDKNLLKD